MLSNSGSTEGMNIKDGWFDLVLFWFGLVLFLLFMCCWQSRLSFCLVLRARQTCWSTLRARHWTLCVRSTVQLSPAGSIRTEQLPPSSSTILTTSHNRYSNSLRPRPTHSPHHCTSPKLSPNHRPHLRLISTPLPSNIPSYRLSLWFKLFQNRRPILNPHPCPRSSFRTKASSRGQQDLWMPSPRKRWSVTILRDPADPQPVPTENPTQRETERARQRWRSRWL